MYVFMVVGYFIGRSKMRKKRSKKGGKRRGEAKRVILGMKLKRLDKKFDMRMVVIDAK